MQEIRELKTRDPKILEESIREITGQHAHLNPLGDIGLLTKAVETFAVDTYLIFNRELKKWVFTDMLDDDLVYQDYFKNTNFVIVENDIGMALARGIHYRVHKKVRP